MSEIYKYVAFISYRHVENDKSCAEWLLKELETFKTPKALLDAGYPSKLGRIFRDKDELPSSGSLNNQLESALKDSRFLIVLCSPDTPVSKWVSKEIELFKQLGRADKIIPVLLEGNPETSYPKVLRTTQNITFEEELNSPLEFDWEPIGADFREFGKNKNSEIKNTEFLRVVASIFSCSFDDLKQRELERQRIKKRNKMAIGFASVVFVLLCLWLVYSSYQKSEEERLVRIETQRVKTADAIKEVEEKSNILANLAKQQDNSTTAALVALDAWNHSNTLPIIDFSQYMKLPIEQRITSLKQDYVELDHMPVDHAAASAQVRGKLSDSRETFFRRRLQDDLIISFSKNAKQLATAYNDGIYYVEDVNTGKLLLTGQSSADIDNVLLDSQTLHVLTRKGYFQVDVTTDQVTHEIDFEDDVLHNSVFSADRKYAALVFRSVAVKYINLATTEMTNVAQYDLFPEISWPGEHLLLAHRSKYIGFDVSKNKTINEIDIGEDIDDMIMDATNISIGIGLRVKKDLFLMSNFKTGVKQQIQIKNEFSRYLHVVDFNANRLFVGLYKKHILVYDIVTGKQTDTKLNCQNEVINEIKLLDKNSLLAAGTESGSVCIWSSLDFELISEKTYSDEATLSLEYNAKLASVFATFRSGEVIGIPTKQTSERQRLPFCESQAGILFAESSGRYLFARAGEMGLCRWDLDDGNKMNHMPSFTMLNPLIPFFAHSNEMVLVNRVGDIILGSMPELDDSRILTVEGEVFLSVGLYGQGSHILGHAASGNMYVWERKNLQKVIRLEKKIPVGAMLFPTSDLSKYVPLYYANGEAHIFNVVNGEWIVSIESDIQIEFVETNIKENQLLLMTNDRQFYSLSYDKLDRFNNHKLDIAELPSYTLNTHLLEPFLPMSVSGSVYLIDPSGGDAVFKFTRTKYDEYFTSGTFINKAFDRKVAAAISENSDTRALSVVLQEVPKLATRNSHSQYFSEMEEAKKLAGSELDIWSNFWKLESQSWLFEQAVSSVDRCLTPLERKQLNLPKDPPCWCDKKVYPLVEDWVQDLGYNPFIDVRKDGSTCETKFIQTQAGK